MVKAYLRYEQEAVFGLVVSPSCGSICFDQSGRSILTGALERLLVWDVRKGTLLQQLSPQPAGAGYSQGGAGAASAAGSVHDAVPAVADVTAICPSPADATQVAAGYTDGTVRVWNMVDGTCRTSLAGHRSGVAVVRYNAAGALLASGGRDADIVVWDVAGEVGLVRLRGHRDQVTDLTFLEGSLVQHQSLLISCSKDAQIKVWDLALHHCIQTIAEPRGELWTLAVHPSLPRLVAAGTEPEVLVFQIRAERGRVVGVGQGAERALSVRFDGPGKVLACQSAGKAIELFRVRTPGEAIRQAKRRRRRQVEKGKGKGGTGEGGVEEEAEGGGEGVGEGGEGGERRDGGAEVTVEGADEFASMFTIRLKHRVRAIAFAPKAAGAGGAGGRGGGKGGAEPSLALALHNNSVEIHTIHADSSTRAASLQSAGHRSDVRSLALSSDGSLLLSVSKGSAKVWNPVTGACLSSFDSGYGLCCLFAPGDRYAISGTQSGDLEVFSVASAERTALIQAAHDKAVWAMAPLADNTGFATASADGCVKFWEYQMQLLGTDSDKDALAAGRGEKHLTVVNTRTLKMSDDVLSLAFSPDGRYIALSLLDSTIKVFFVDSLRFFLSLYGHKLPAICLDISSDSQLAVSGSADKSVKIWGLDFGDCHRSLFAHQDSVMCVKFVPRTHYFFSCGKDRRVRYWDADKFQLLLTLEGHHAEVWSLAISPLGDFLVSGSHDRSIRRWQRTDEPFFLEEEREKQLEAMFEARAVALPNEGRRPEGGEDEEGGEGAEASMGGGGAVGELGGVGGAARGTQETVWAADSIIEAVELASMEEARMTPFIKDPSDPNSLLPSFQPNVLLLGHSPAGFVLRALASVKPSELEQALLVLPFTVALRILHFAPHWLHHPLPQLEFAARALVSLVRIHHSQLIATPTARPLLAAVHTLLRVSLKDAVATVGCNLAAISHIKSLLASSQASMDGGDATGMAEKVREIRERLAKGRNAVIAEKLHRSKAEKRKRRAEKKTVLKK
ncbi:hypothetical protein CLOP_g7111 [Closterium sp. NIES-67]|nr:hypothetical protein CLOP_g7111 [Closterium sp. NIES-67]